MVSIGLIIAMRAKYTASPRLMLDRNPVIRGMRIPSAKNADSRAYERGFINGSAKPLLFYRNLHNRLLFLELARAEACEKMIVMKRS